MILRTCLLACVALGAIACEPEATRSLLQRARDERQEWLREFERLADPAERARYDADLARLGELGIVPEKVAGTERWTLGAEAHRGARWALASSGTERAELDSTLRDLGAARGRYVVHLLQIERDGWRMQLVDAVLPEIKFPELKEPGFTWKSRRRKQLEADLASIDLSLSAVRARLSASVRPSYVASTRKHVELALLGASSLEKVHELLQQLPADRSIVLRELSGGTGRLMLTVDPPLADAPPGATKAEKDGLKGRVFFFGGPKKQP